MTKVAKIIAVALFGPIPTLNPYDAKKLLPRRMLDSTKFGSSNTMELNQMVVFSAFDFPIPEHGSLPYINLHVYLAHQSFVVLFVPEASPFLPADKHS